MADDDEASAQEPEPEWIQTCLAANLVEVLKQQVRLEIERDKNADDRDDDRRADSDVLAVAMTRQMMDFDQALVLIKKAVGLLKKRGHEAWIESVLGIACESYGATGDIPTDLAPTFLAAVGEAFQVKPDVLRLFRRTAVQSMPDRKADDPTRSHGEGQAKAFGTYLAKGKKKLKQQRPLWKKRRRRRHLRALPPAH